ncbi:MAG: lysophospholipase [Pseudomonadota bacterium]|nr:lysophospholipase [Pseudomonadota bacterium]
MIAFFLTAVISHTLHAKDVLEPPANPPAGLWSAVSEDERQPIEVKLSEGPKVRGWLYKSARPDAPFVLFFYGSNEDLVHEAARLKWLRDAFQVNAVCFDYPGYGFSQGSIDARLVLSAALQEFDHVREHLASPAVPIISYGWSIGTGIAIHVAAHRAAAGLILQAPPASAREMMQWSTQREVPWYGRWLIKLTADPLVGDLYEGSAHILAVASPLLLIQGQFDDVVSPQQGREVFDASPAKEKTFVEIPGAHHNDLKYQQAPASDAVGRFLQNFASP